MHETDIERVLLTAGEISDRVSEMAREISESLKDGDVVVLGVLTGAFVFLADLVRRLESPVRVGFVQAASYGEDTRPGPLKVEFVGRIDLEGKDVLIVEDILDTGSSLSRISEIVRKAGPRSLQTAVLLDKVDRREVEVPVDYVGFEVPDEFLVGYGLDYAGRYRQLAYVGVLSRSVYEGED